MRVEISQDLLSVLRMLGQNQLQMVPQRGFHRRNVLVRHPNTVGQRAQHASGSFEGSQRSTAEAFVIRLYLTEEFEPGLLLGLWPDQLFQNAPRLLRFLLHLAQSLLPL